MEPSNNAIVEEEKGKPEVEAPKVGAPHYPTALEIVDALISKAELAQRECGVWKAKYYELDKTHQKTLEENKRLLRAHNEPIIKERVTKVLGG